MTDTTTAGGRTGINGKGPKVLLVTSSRSDAERIAFLLNGQSGLDIAGICQPSDVLGAVARLRPQVALLSLRGPDGECLKVCEKLRQGSDVAIVICSTGATEAEVVAGLEAGADDYLVMPMQTSEFEARVRAASRETRASETDADDGRLRAGDLELDIELRRAYCRGREIELSPTEIRLLSTLMRQAGRPVSHSKLLAQTWGPEYVDARNYIRLYIKRLRSKLEEDPEDPKLIVNERGIGYRLQPGAAA